MMDFKEFNDYIEKYLKDFLPEELQAGELLFHIVEKDNGQKYHGISLMNEDSRICPTIYMERYFEQFQRMDGDFYDLRKIMTDMGNTLENAIDQSTEYEGLLNRLRDPEYAKRKIFPVLVDHSRNRSRLREGNIPHRYLPELEMDMYYRIVLSESSMVVNKNLAEIFQMTEMDLYQTAMSNLNQSEIICKRLADFMMENEKLPKELKPMCEELPLFILTTPTKMYGAACLALTDSKIFEELEDKIGEKVYILPSSVYELLVVPQLMPLQEVRTMVREINRSDAIEPDMYLSDHVYTYDSLQKKITIAREAEPNLIRRTYQR